MGMIIQNIEIIGDKGRGKVKTLLDSGASDSVIRRDVAEKITTFIKLPKPLKFVLGNGKSTMESEYFSGISFILKGYTFPAQRVLIVDQLEEDLILGVDVLQRWRLKLDFEKEDVIIDKEMLKIRLI